MHATLALPSEPTVSALTAAAGNAYMTSTRHDSRPIFSPSVSSYTQHLFHARRPSAQSGTIMPRPNPPPTPGSSSDIRGKEGAHGAPAFNLPPTAYQEADRASSSSGTPSANGSDSSYRPVSPAPPAASHSRKRSADQKGPVVTKDDFALPPPPTRSRKIIQMKPQSSESVDQSHTGASTSPQAKGNGTPQTNGKRKQNSGGTTAAGRKIARKTAHSLIERRRRSKMNEEFGVLKDMIPACQGQEMHKLAILSASIEYLRYLEKCVSDLQAQQTSPRPPPPPSAPQSTQDDDPSNDEDEEMQDPDPPTTASTPVTTAPDRSASLISLPSLSQITTASTTSPSSFPSERHYSVSSASQASYSPYFHSTHTSPAFGPQISQGSYREVFGLGSPALQPLDSRKGGEGALKKQRSESGKVARSEQELDQEATAALLMLNHDRRSWKGRQSEGSGTGRSGTGMSVRDLLSG
ncbi:uncharacterized protein LTR77_006916 [Saxophila tyrrhenica]|uniref:BHLH domain-containing protein n=1 Tax=Saxophila tyrrhenica TaxID=1690608 RepID=A0AAV9PAB1_9PEZI|nr:hypothetical protein LTR77_006916 [Saxophila tyrrhenica]